MATASSSKTAVDEAPQENWMELKLLQSIVMQSRLGQTVLKLVDNFLWVTEKCTEWSLPRQEVSGDENRKDSGKPELVRPLPWLLFLPSLVLLRVLRVTVNIGASILSYPKITPNEMVKFVQICRRHLNVAMNKGKERYELKVTTTSEEKSVTESMDSTAKVKDSTNESEEEEKEETLNEKLDRLALESSGDDEDFDPTKCDFSNDTSSDEDDDENSDDGNISATEVRDVFEDTISCHRADIKNTIEWFMKAEKTSALPTQQEFVEPACGKRSPAKESRDKVEERLATSQRIDSPECFTSDKSSQEGDPTFYSPISSDSDAPKESSVSIAEQYATREILKTNEFINGEVRFISQSASTISESKSSGETNNGAVVQKRSTNVSKYHKGKRTSHRKKK